MKEFEIYIKGAMYKEEAETMLDALLQFAQDYPLKLSEILGIIEICDDTTWIKRG